MMQGRLAALSAKYDIYFVPNFINMHYISSDSHRKMLCYDINNILRNTGTFWLKGSESEKLLFILQFLNWDISVDI